MEADRLFVYGTLRSEFENRYATELRACGELVGRKNVVGSIFRVQHFPAYRPEPAGVVRGELYRLDDAARLLRILDEYEGSEFERVIVDCEGEAVWIYQFRLQPPAVTRIESGDFCRP